MSYSERALRKRTAAVYLISSSSDSDVEEINYKPPPKKAKHASNLGPKRMLRKSKDKCKETTASGETSTMLSATVNHASSSVHTTSQQPDDDEHCVICMSSIENKKTLHLCQHSFCTECIDQWFQKSNPTCPSCGVIYGLIIGTQPESGSMYHNIHHNMGLPGYEGCGSIVIEYHFPDGIQGPEHPNPGQHYSGTSRVAYLPNNAEGQKVLRLLQVAFQRRLVFTVGRSVTTGRENTVVWNDIHHKTNPYGGQHGFGYPDATYLNRVQLELAAKGVIE